MKTLNDWVLVSPNESEQQFTPGGLTLPESMQKPLRSGMVVGIAEQVVLANGKRIDADVVYGDQVYWLRNSGYSWNEGGKSYVLLRFGELIGTDRNAPRGSE